VQFTAEFYVHRLLEQLSPGGNDSAMEPERAAPDGSELLALQDNAAFVRYAYLFCLGREPDLDGFLHYCKVLQDGAPREAVVTELKNSAGAGQVAPAPVIAPQPAAAEIQRSPAPELADLLTIPSARDFVVAAYRRILGRDPEPAGLKNHIGALLDGCPREMVLYWLASSYEGAQSRLPFTLKGRPLSGKAPLPLRARYVYQTATGGRTRDLAALAESMHATLQSMEAAIAQMKERQGALEWSMSHLGQRIDQVGNAAREQHDGIQAHIDDLAAAQRSLASDVAARQQGLHEAVEAARTGIHDVWSRVKSPVISAADGVLATDIDGFTVGIPAEEWRLAVVHALGNDFEPGLTRRFEETVKPGMTVVDVGANIGIFTLWAARLSGPRGKVFGFEPSPRTFEALRDNVRVNGFSAGQVVVRQCAITDRRGRARLATYRHNCGHNTLFPGGGDTEFADVETASLDELLRDESHVDVVKIDAEGAEPLIWRGMRETLARNAGIQVFLEFAPTHLRRGGFDPAAFLEEIESAGFQIAEVHPVTGAILQSCRQELLAAYSANLLAGRPAG
jgi:FkbM family methyltransferase